MIQKFVDRFMAKKDQLREQFKAQKIESYSAIVRAVVDLLVYDHDFECDSPDPERIHEIDDGNYQGTLVFVVGAQGYDPFKYWYVRISYGSCSGCDTLERINMGSWGDIPTDSQVNQYMDLALYVVQCMKLMDEEVLS